MSEYSRTIHEQEREAARRYASDYDQAYESLFWRVERRSFAKLVERYARRNGIALSSARILDVGTGTGSLLVQFRELGACHLAGADISPEMLAQARRKMPEAELWLGPIEEAGFSPESFDVVTGFSVLHHLPDLERFFTWLACVLKPGGIFAFSDPYTGSVLNRNFSKWIVWALAYPLHKPLRLFNRDRLSHIPTMADVEYYSDAHRALGRDELYDALPPNLTADVSSHGIFAPTFNNALVDRGLDLVLMRALYFLDRLLPFGGDILVTLGRRKERGKHTGACPAR